MEARGKAVQTRECGNALLQLKGQFERWRAERKVGERIPTALWAGAVAAASVHGAYRVAAELHLDYAVLKRRAALVGGKATATEVAPRFVELFAPTAPTRSEPQCVVELGNARGARMRVELSGSAVEALTVLCARFWAA
jgi:hypothetical protein